MRKLTSILFLILLILLTFVISTGFADYTGRMKEHNRANCAILGKQEDCKTPRTGDQALCDSFYGKGMCDTNGELYPEYTKQVIDMYKGGDK